MSTLLDGPLSDQEFSSFQELSGKTVEYLRSQGFVFATPVQAAVLPIFFGHKDVVVEACTGSGKTLAFLLPVLEKLNKMEKQCRKYDVLFMIISPTRELASQTFQVAKPLFETLSTFSILRLVGGSEVAEDLRESENIGGNVIVGTPGRISDIMRRSKTLNFGTLEVLVLDEADRLLDLGFEIQLLEIIHSLPKQRRTGLFSATQDDACEALIKAGLRNPVRVNVTTTVVSGNKEITDFSYRTPQCLKLSALVLSTNQKFNQLILFLKTHPAEKIIVYGLTCACVDYWFYVLRRLEDLKALTIRSLHGKMNQNGRVKAIEAFKEDQSGILLATDVAARGLDIPLVDWVVQMDAPQDPRAFIHRVGRTARLGRSGNAIIFLTSQEQPYIKFLQLRKVPVEQQEMKQEGKDFLPWLRKLSETDREAMVKGVTAYTSYVRAYSNHYCPYIFRVKDLDLGQLAYSYGLLYLPGMKEIKEKKKIDFVPSDVDPVSVKFSNKTREEQRQKWIAERMEQKKKENKMSGGKTKKRKLKGQQTVEKPKRSRNQVIRDLEELEEDYKMYKSEKKTKRKPTEDEKLAINNDLGFPSRQLQPDQRHITTVTKESKKEVRRDPELQISLRKKLESMKKLRRRKPSK